MNKAVRNVRHIHFRLFMNRWAAAMGLRTYVQMAKIMGVSKTTMSRWLKSDLPLKKNMTKIYCITGDRRFLPLRGLNDPFL